MCCLLLSGASLSEVSQYFCQPFHNLINNNLLLDVNVEAKRPNKIYLFLQSKIFVSKLDPSVQPKKPQNLIVS